MYDKVLQSCQVSYFDLLNHMFTYLDENECLNNNAGCAQNCVNTIGSYSCTCNSGFNLSVDMHNCTGTNSVKHNIILCSYVCS